MNSKTRSKRRRHGAARSVRCVGPGVRVTEVLISQHAIARYIDRAKPCLDRGQAVEDLARLIEAFGSIHEEAPDWHQGRAKRRSDLYLYVAGGDEYILPLASKGRNTAVACSFFSRSGVSDLAREAKRRRKRKGRRKKVGTSAGHQKVRRTLAA